MTRPPTWRPVQQMGTGPGRAKARQH